VRLLAREPLAGATSPLAAARAFAARQEPVLSARLQPGIRLRYVFGTPTAEGHIPYHVEIAPNTTSSGPAALCPSPGVSAPGIGSEARHGSQPPSNRTLARIHHTQSEHIIPFATARSLRLAVGLTERSRRVLSGFDRGMITLMIYRGAAERKNNADNTLSAAFEAQMNAARVPNKLRQARASHASGDTENAEDLGREALGGILGALETLRQSAVARTQAAIAAEWADTETGCSQTNGQRRGEAAAVPANPAVEGAASRQYDGIIELVSQALLADA
jgi:hypothetical protein